MNGYFEKNTFGRGENRSRVEEVIVKFKKFGRNL